MSLNFRKTDFQEVYYSCIFVNQTSGTEFRNYKQVKVEEFLNKGLTLIVPTNSCNISHNLMVLFFKGRSPKIPKKIPEQGEGKGIRYSAIGKIKAKEQLDSNPKFSTISIDFVQYDKYGWDEFIEEYREKQEDVTSTFNRIQIHEE